MGSGSLIDSAREINQSCNLKCKSFKYIDTCSAAAVGGMKKLMQERAKSDLRQNTYALPRDTNAVIVLYFLFSVHFQGASYVFLVFYQNSKDTELSFFLSRSLIQHF